MLFNMLRGGKTRSLVRHREFNTPGILNDGFVRVLVWDEGVERSAEEIGK
jgi:hypothetical protein